MLNNIQKKKNFDKSIVPLKKDIFLSFLVWKLSLYNMYKDSAFWNRRYQKKIRKNLKRIGDSSQNAYIVLSVIVLFFGLIQVFLKYTSLPILEFFTENLSTFNRNKFSYNWKTFHILNSTYSLRPYPISHQYQKIDFLNNSISLKLTPFFQNHYNQISIGFIPTKNIIIKNNYYHNFFNYSRFSISSKINNFALLDTIPRKMESTSSTLKRKTFSTLFTRKLNKNKIKYYFSTNCDIQHLEINRRLKPILNNSKLRVIKKNIRKLRLKSYLRTQKNLIIKNENILKFYKKTQFKKIIFKFYRDLFYKDNYLLLDPETYLGAQTKYSQKPNAIWHNLVCSNLNYLDLFNIIQKSETSFFNSTLRPRLLSGYWFPDFTKLKYTPVSKNKPLIIHVKLPGKYRSLFMHSFFKELKKQKSIFKNKYNFEIVQNNIFYPKTRPIKTYRNINYRKQLTIYRKSNFLYLKRIPGLKSIFELYFKNSPQTLGFRNHQFYDVREPIQSYSWLIVTQIGLAIFGFKLLQYLYQEYGKEIVLSLINLINLIGILPDAEWLKDELNLTNYGKGFRAVRRVKKSFKQSVGITPLMAHLSEPLWYLRAKKTRLSGFFKYQVAQHQSFILQPILLIGPPGTGKTLLVQALAGEAGVPVLLQSGSVLKDFRQRGKGARSIQNLFRRARQITPCVVFIDEVDGVGVRRENLSLNPMGGQDTIDAINDAGLNPISFEDLTNFQPKTQLKNLLEEEENLEFDEIVNFGETLTEANQRNLLRIKVLQETQVEQHSRTEQLSILIQLLIELDGLTPLNDIMVFGATNRPHILDPALLRPGRFYKILKLRLPDQQKRIEVLKLYVSYMGKNISLPWYYFSQRLEGLSAADISAVVNESALISICHEKKHTIQSLEQGLERITSYSSAKNLADYKRKLLFVLFSLRSRWVANTFFMNNYHLKRKRVLQYRDFVNLSVVNNFLYSTRFKGLSYYESGKSIVHSILPQHPSSVYFAIQNRTKNFRYISMHGLVLSLIDQIKFRFELEERLVGLLAGKASEFMPGYASILPHLKNIISQPKYNISSIGMEDKQSATLLAFLMVEKWYFYAKKICTQIYHPILNNFNFHEFYQEDVKLFQAIFEDIESEIDTQNRLISKSQKWSFRTWWQKQLIDEQSFFDKSLMDWYRIYLAEPEEDERNIEWVPPDDYYNSLSLRSVNSSIYWSDFLKLTYDHLYHALLLNCFNISFSILNKNRELLDYLVDFVARYEKVRNHQIQILVPPFMIKKSVSKKIGLNNEKTIFLKDWGPRSRRNVKRNLNIEEDPKIELKNFISESFQKLEIPEYLFKDTLD